LLKFRKNPGKTLRNEKSGKIREKHGEIKMIKKLKKINDNQKLQDGVVVLYYDFSKHHDAT
jgi:hypothetical protein